MTTSFNRVAIGNYYTAQNPVFAYLFTTENYATITTAGFLNNIGGTSQLQVTDIVVANYGGLNGFFNVAIDSSKVITLSPLVSTGEVVLPVVSGNLAMFSGTAGAIADANIIAANVLLTTTDVTDYQQVVSLGSIISTSAGTWTRTRIAEGNYVLRHTAADDTTIMGIDITPQLRAAAGRGFKLASVDVVYSIGTLALDAHTLTLDSIAYANNVAAAVTSVPLTGSLSTATQANPYLTNVTVTTPAFLVTANAKYVLELTVNAAATSAYDFYGLNLHFTKSVA